MHIRPLIAPLALALSLPIANAQQTQASPSSQQAQQTGTEEEAPSQASQHSMPFFMLPAGLPAIVLQFDQYRVIMILDSGASQTTLHSPFVEMLGVDAQPIRGARVAGVGTDDGRPLRVGDLDVYIGPDTQITMSGINAINLGTLQRFGDGAYVGGVIGSNFFAQTKAVLDYSTNTLHFSAESTQSSAPAPTQEPVNSDSQENTE